MTKTVKNILVKLELDGKGIVNYDSNDQKYMARKTRTLKNNTNYSNIMFAKKNFIKVGETENNEPILDYKIKISNNSLNNAVFSDSQVENNTAIAHHKMLLYMNMATVSSILRGYLWTDGGFKKSSILTLCDAVQSNNAQSSIEIFTKSGVKNKNEGSDVSDTSLFFKETVGDITYETIGNIDLKKLQFISCDSLFDRLALNPDDFEIYKQFLNKNLPNSEYIKLDYYLLKNTIVNIPEYGILFNNDNIVYMVKELIEKILSINIQKKGSFAKTKSLKIKLVYDSLIDTFENSENWITITSREDINNLNFETNFIYIPVNKEESLRIRTEFETQQNIAKEIQKQRKAEKNKASKKNKEESSNESQDE